MLVRDTGATSSAIQFSKTFDNQAQIINPLGQACEGQIFWLS
jgi:hypothetical protein